MALIRDDDQVVRLLDQIKSETQQELVDLASALQQVLSSNDDLQQAEIVEQLEAVQKLCKSKQQIGHIIEQDVPWIEQAGKCWQHCTELAQAQHTAKCLSMQQNILNTQNLMIQYIEKGKYKAAAEQCLALESLTEAYPQHPSAQHPSHNSSHPQSLPLPTPHPHDASQPNLPPLFIPPPHDHPATSAAARAETPSHLPSTSPPIQYGDTTAHLTSPSTHADVGEIGGAATNYSQSHPPTSRADYSLHLLSLFCQTHEAEGQGGVGTPGSHLDQPATPGGGVALYTPRGNAFIQFTMWQHGAQVLLPHFQTVQCEHELELYREVCGGLEVLGLVDKAVKMVEEVMFPSLFYPLISSSVRIRVKGKGLRMGMGWRVKCQTALSTRVSRTASSDADGSCASHQSSNSLVGAGGAINGKHKIGEVENQLVQILSFVNQAMFPSLPIMLSAFMRRVWPQITVLYLSQSYAAQYAPKSDADITVLNELIQHAHSMEDTLRKQGVLQASWNPTQLTPALRSHLTTYLRSKVYVHLAQARDMLTTCYLSGDTQLVGQPLRNNADQLESLLRKKEAVGGGGGGESSGLSLDDVLMVEGMFEVSVQVDTIASVVWQIIQEAVLADSPGIFSAYCDAIGDLCVLVRQIPPVVYPQHLAIPRLTITHANNMHVLARHISRIPFHVSNVMALVNNERIEQLQRTCLQEASVLSAAAQSAYATCVQALLADVVAGVPGLTAAIEAIPGTKARGSGKKLAAQAVHTLVRLARSLQVVVVPRLFVEMVGQAVETTCAACVVGLLSKDEIGVSDCDELPALLRCLGVDLLGELWTESRVNGVAWEQGDTVVGGELPWEGGRVVEAKGGGIGKGVMVNALKWQAKSCVKLDALLDLCEVKLAEIVRAWEAGELSAKGVSVLEVKRMVKAIFEDTEYRASQLERII